MTQQTSTPNLHCIVIGNPIAHSQSPALHHAFAAQTGVALRYQRQLCPVDEASFVAVIEAFFAGGGTGANVTVPFKQTAFDLVQARGTLSQAAQAARAVNTLAWQDGALYGDNTDGRGLVNHMRELGWDLAGQNVLILGAGGATRGVVWALLDAGVARIHIANRTPAKAQAIVTQFATNNVLNQSSANLSASGLFDLPQHTFDLVINATSSALTAEADASLPFDSQLRAAKAYDLMYGKPSQFLQFFAEHGAQTSDGLGMLIHQGALSFALWTGKNVDLVALGNPFAH